MIHIGKTAINLCVVAYIYFVQYELVNKTACRVGYSGNIYWNICKNEAWAEDWRLKKFEVQYKSEQKVIL